MKEQTDSLTSLVKKLDLSLNAASVFQALIRIGIMREVEYSSTTGSGFMKKYKELTPLGLEFGENKITGHEFKTEPKFYPSRFRDLLALVLEQLNSELSGI